MAVDPKNPLTYADLGPLAGDTVWPHNPAIAGGDLYTPSPAFAPTPWTVPTWAPATKVGIHPEFADLGQRPALIDFDFTKRRYLGI